MHKCVALCFTVRGGKKGEINEPYSLHRSLNWVPGKCYTPCAVCERTSQGVSRL